MIPVLSLGNNIFRLSLCAASTARNISISSNPLCFGLTNVLLGEPLKKKKRVDPAILRQRQERKRRKIEKQIRRLEKTTKQSKPVEEIEIPLKLIEEKEKRTHHRSPLSLDEMERRMLLEKVWGRYKLQQHLRDVQRIDAFLVSQRNALNELKAESEELYNEAIQIDLAFLPYNAMGPVRTPPLVDYDSPDGEYIDITRKYEGET